MRVEGEGRKEADMTVTVVEGFVVCHSITSGTRTGTALSLNTP